MIVPWVVILQPSRHHAHKLWKWEKYIFFQQTWLQKSIESK